MRGQATRAPRLLRACGPRRHGDTHEGPTPASEGEVWPLTGHLEKRDIKTAGRHPQLEADGADSASGIVPRDGAASAQHPLGPLVDTAKETAGARRSPWRGRLPPAKTKNPSGDGEAQPGLPQSVQAEPTASLT